MKLIVFEMEFKNLPISDIQTVLKLPLEHMRALTFIATVRVGFEIIKLN